MGDINETGNKISRRRLVKLLGMSAASAAVLAACGDPTATTAPATTAAGTTAAGTTAGATTAAGTTAAATTAAQAITGKVIFASNKSNGGPKKLVDTYNGKATGISIEFQEFPNDSQAMHDKFVTVLGAKDGSYDIIASDMPWTPEFAAAGYIGELDKYLTPEVRKNFFEGSLAGASYKDKLFGLPWYQNVGVLFYRKDLLDTAGVKPPTTFAELEAAATKLQTAETYGYIYHGFKNEGLSAMWVEILWGFGGEFWDPATGKVLVNSPEAEASLQWLIDSIYTKKIGPEKILTFKGPDVQNTFAQGNAVFARAFSSAIGQFEGAESKVKGKWGVVPMVADTGKKSAGCLGNWNLSISSSSKNPAAAYKFIEYMTSLEAQKIFTQTEGVLPSLRQAFDDKDLQAANPTLKTLETAFGTAKPRPVTPAYPQISSEAIQEYVTKAMSKQMSPKDAVKAMADKATEILAKFK
jgi:multiple sugar transport system substrate-binding protein